ncbi:hypothetical protein F5883DRAFT_641398 [Diaporthe sp. PMI_573]|nr:hypothetical protein F5883DRAFT_641398 [Diaporthaceae sp. PMI_573]
MKLTAYILPVLALGAYAAPAIIDGTGSSAVEARGPANAPPPPPPPPPAPAQGGAPRPPRAVHDSDIEARDPQGRPPPRGGNRAGNGGGNSGAGRPPPPPPNRRGEIEELE